MASPSNTSPSASTSSASRTVTATTCSLVRGTASRWWGYRRTWGSSLGLAVDDHGLAPVDRVAHPAGHGPTGVRGVARPGGEAGRIDDPLGGRIDHTEAGGGAGDHAGS